MPPLSTKLSRHFDKGRFKGLEQEQNDDTSSQYLQYMCHMYPYVSENVISLLILLPMLQVPSDQACLGQCGSESSHSQKNGSIWSLFRRFQTASSLFPREWYSIAKSILRDFLETEPGTESNEPKKSVETCNSLDSHHRCVLRRNMSKCLRPTENLGRDEVLDSPKARLGKPIPSDL